MMAQKMLEIRGISRADLVRYLIQLKGKAIEDQTQDTFAGTGWCCTLSQEESFIFLQSKIPKVFVTFTAEESETLEQIIKDFRLKTFRAGG
jgi:hypothetical protein